MTSHRRVLVGGSNVGSLLHARWLQRVLGGAAFLDTRSTARCLSRRVLVGGTLHLTLVG
jgi:hypothetical protein